MFHVMEALTGNLSFVNQLLSCLLIRSYLSLNEVLPLSSFGLRNPMNRTNVSPNY